MNDFWASILIGAGLGFGLGLLASYTVWWITAHLIVPRVEFSTQIAKRRFGQDVTQYQIAFKNAGRRSMVDLEIVVRIGVYKFMGATGWAYHEIGTNARRVPDLKPGELSRRVVRIFDNRHPISFIDAPSKKIREELERHKTLEGLLGIKEDAAVRVHVFGYDSFSGTRKLFQSKEYRSSDISEGRFDGLVISADNRRYAE